MPLSASMSRVVEEQPRDWNTANLVGDLHFRAGEVDKAVASTAGLPTI